MTPKMIDALRDAKAFNRRGGLRYSVAGWEGRLYTYHSASSVTACAERGFLQPEGKGKKRCMRITDAGRAALMEAT